MNGRTVNTFTCTQIVSLRVSERERAGKRVRHTVAGFSNVKKGTEIDFYENVLKQIYYSLSASSAMWPTKDTLIFIFFFFFQNLVSVNRY